MMEALLQCKVICLFLPSWNKDVELPQKLYLLVRYVIATDQVKFRDQENKPLNLVLCVHTK